MKQQQLDSADLTLQDTELSGLGFDTAIQSSHEAWRQLLENESLDMLGLDVTSSLPWVNALKAVWGEEYSFGILTANTEQGIEGVFPYCRANNQSAVLKPRVLMPAFLLYCGRTGFLSRKLNGDVIKTFIQHLLVKRKDWDVLILQLVDDSPSSKQFKLAVDELGASCQVLVQSTSPYIDLKNGWADYEANLSKKFRYNLRSREKKLNEKGSLTYHSVISADQVDEFLELIVAIEKQSWKEKAGTSITTNTSQLAFYKEFTKVAAENGWLYGNYLKLDDEPIAYNYSLIFSGICYSLKSSYVDTYSKYNPGNILRKKHLQAICDLGVSYYDMMGNADKHKMQWTDEVYHQSKYVLYNNTLRGRLARLRSLFKQKLNRPEE